MPQQSDAPATPDRETVLASADRLKQQVLIPMKRTFVGKDAIIDLLGICLVGGENLFLLGPPGTAKSALVQELGRLIDGQTFDYLLTRFTEPNELFGPFDIRRLREGELVTNTEGMLPEASLVFLDELLNANSAILNSLLLVLNERLFRRGRETRPLPTLMVVGASNQLPEDEALQALFDRFLLRVNCDNVDPDHLHDVLAAGWALEQPRETQQSRLTSDDIRAIQTLLPSVEVDNIRETYIGLIHQLRNAGIPISDRRAVKLQRLIAASALLSGRTSAQASDLWVLRYIWDRREQEEVLASIVDETIDQTPPRPDDHPRAREPQVPNPDELARELQDIADRLARPDCSPADLAVLKDRLRYLAGRCEWVQTGESRDYLHEQVDQLWQAILNQTS